MVAAILVLADLRLHPSERDQQDSRFAPANRVCTVEGFHGGGPTEPTMVQKTFLDYRVLLSEDVPNVIERGGEKASLWPTAAKRP